MWFSYLQSCYDRTKMENFENLAEIIKRIIPKISRHEPLFSTSLKKLKKAVIGQRITDDENRTKKRRH